MIGHLTIGESCVQLDEARLALSRRGESRWMCLTASGADAGLGMCEIEFQCLENLDDLDGRRMHVRFDGSTYPDDTLGTDITGMYEATDVNYLQTGSMAWSFGDIQIDFRRLGGQLYEVRLRATLTEDDFDCPGDLPEEAYTGTASARFEVEITEQ